MERKDKKNESSGLWYLGAALLGLAAGFIAKTVYDDVKEESKSNQQRFYRIY